VPGCRAGSDPTAAAAAANADADESGEYQPPWS
jgi:hypothetical protein